MFAKLFAARRFSLLCAAALILAASTSSAEVPDNAVWIDVRTTEEFATGHVEDALLIPWQRIEKGVASLQLERDAPIYLYCAVGGRAGMAKQRLEKAGYTNVMNAGGVDDARKLKGSTPQ